MSISISGSNLTTGFNNTVQSPPYGSISFNGLNQSIVTSGTGSGANGTILDLTTGSPNWTVECWIYTSQLSRQDVPQIPLNKGNGQTLDIRVISGNNSYVTVGTNFLQAQFYSTTLGWIYMNSWPTTMSLNTWYHVAVCKDTTNGNRYYLYLNGVLVSSTPDIANPATNNGQPFEFGMAISETGGDPSYAFNGLLSNIRIVKGVALYVPPVVSEPSLPLTSTQSLNLSGYNQAITGTQTSLLLNHYLTDASSYAQTVTGVNKPSASTLAPYTYTAGNSGSISLSGSGQYLTVSSATAFQFGTSPFTIEGWFYFPSVPSNNGLWQLAASNFPGTAGLALAYISGAWQLDYGTSSAATTIGSGTLLVNTWIHIAVVRNSSNLITIYVNGVGYTAVSSDTTNYNFTTNLVIGGYYSTSYLINGYVSNFRMVNGVAVYTSNFTPPPNSLASTQTANTNGNPSAAITGTQTSLLLNTTNDSNYLVDSSTNNFTVTNNGSATSNPLNPYVAAGSILFNGTNQYLAVPAATQFNYSTNDFTWEMWIYPTAATWTSGTFYLIDHGPQTVNQGLLHYSGNKLMYYNYYNAGNIPPYTSGANFPSLYTIGGGTIPANAWTHVAVCRQNLVTNMFINGQIVSSGPDPYNYATLSGAPFVNPIVSPATQSVRIGARADGAYPFKGNISNVRIVNGVSVYNVGNFTPPVQPLPAVQVSNNIGSPSKAITSNQTSLLMNTSYNSSFLTDGSFNNVTLTQQTVGSFPPSTYTLTSNSANPFNSNGSIFTPGSIFFNGTSQYLTVPDNAAFNLTGDFTIESWFCVNSGTGGGIVGIGTADTNVTTLRVYLGKIQFWVISSANYGQGTTSIVNGTWYHVAVVRSGTGTNNCKCYLNGVLECQITDNSTPSSSAVVVGRDYPTSSDDYFPGYISNLRIVKGAAVYTQNFTPTSGPFTTSQTFNQSGIPSCPVQSSQTSLLLTTPSNSSYLTDSSTNAFTVTNNGSATSNPFNPFSDNYTILANPGSVQLNGTSQYLNTAASTALTLTGDFTIECWFYDTNIAANESLYGKRPDSATYGGVSLYHVSSGNLSFLGTTTGTTWEVQFNSTIATPANQWHHVAITRSGNVYTMWVNGQSAGTQTVTGAILANPTIPFTIGAGSQIGTTPWSGYISNFRVVNGVAVYTSAFVPPAGPLNNSQVANQSGAPSAAVTSTQTSLLLNTAFGTNFLVDSSINNLTITNVGTATSATLDPFVF
jgi:Concanavalin A-like lectin/glucanases superfamily